MHAPVASGSDFAIHFSLCQVPLGRLDGRHGNVVRDAKSAQGGRTTRKLRVKRYTCKDLYVYVCILQVGPVLRRIYPGELGHRLLLPALVRVVHLHKAVDLLRLAKHPVLSSH